MPEERQAERPADRDAGTAIDTYRVCSAPNLVLLGIAGLACVAAALVVSRNGPAYASDTAVYFGMAQNLLDGQGLTSPITLAFTDYFSPIETAGFSGVIPITTLPYGYPLLLAVVSFLGVSLDTAARVLGAAGLGLAAAILAGMTLRTTRGSWPAATTTLLLFLVAGPLFEGFYPVSWLLLSSYALAEVVYLVLTLVAVLSMASLLRRNRARDVWCTGLLIGAAIATRYLGVALLLAVLVLVAFRPGWDLATRLRRGAALVALGVVPVLVWVIALRVQHGLGDPSTPLRFRPIRAALFTDGAETVAHWFLPTGVQGGLAVLFVVAFLGVTALAVALLMRRQRSDPLLVVMMAVAVAYVATLFGAILLTNSNIGFDGRLLAPVRVLTYVIVVTVVFEGVARLGRSASPSTARALAGGAVVVLGLLVCIPSVRSASRLVRDGGPVGPRPLSGLLAAADALPSDAFVMSNAPETIWLGTGKRSIIVPIRRVSEAGVDNPHFDRDLREAARLLARRDGFLVMFDGYDGLEIATTDEIAARLHLELVQRTTDGAIYRARRAQ